MRGEGVLLFETGAKKRENRRKERGKSNYLESVAESSEGFREHGRGIAVKNGFGWGQLAREEESEGEKGKLQCRSSCSRREKKQLQKKSRINEVPRKKKQYKYQEKVTEYPIKCNPYDFELVVNGNVKRAMSTNLGEGKEFQKKKNLRRTGRKLELLEVEKEVGGGEKKKNLAVAERRSS